MAMPAFDAEPDSGPSPSPEAAAPKPAASEGPRSKSPAAASLISIAAAGKPPVASKAGDLTRLFEIARRQAEAPPETTPIDAPPAAEPAPSATQPAETEDAVEPSALAPAPVEAPAPEEVYEPIEAEAEPIEAAPAAIAVEPVETAPMQVETWVEPPTSMEPVTGFEAAVFERPEPALETARPLLLAPPPIAADTSDELDAWVPAERTAEAEPAQPEPALEPVAPAEDAMATHYSLEAADSTPPVEVAQPLAFEMMPEDGTPQAHEPPASAPMQPEIEPPATPAPVVEAEAELAPEAEPPALAERPAPFTAVPRPTPLPEPPAPAPAPLAVAQNFESLVDYWRSLRVGDDHPPTESLDRTFVSDRWPGSLVIAYTSATQDPRGELRPGQVTRLGTVGAETQEAVDVGSQATEWMLEVARAALLNDEPLEELQRLPTRTGVAGFRMVALPLGPAKGLANGVLCALVPSPAAPRFGKRRAWL